MRDQLSRKEAHAYWRDPPHQNKAQRYLNREARSVVALAEKYIPKDARILELGCSVGETLEALRAAGYSDLTGIEINPESVKLLMQLHGDLFQVATVHIGTIEEVLPRLGGFDLIYSKAVLCHLHPDSEAAVFANMAHQAHTIITIEDEQTSTSGRHFARNYRSVFAAFGFRQVEYVHEPEGLNASYCGRVLTR